MKMPRLSQTVASRIATLWSDEQEDNERLDEIAALNYKVVSHVAADSGVTTYQLVKKIKNARDEPS